ncbi:hypothetical protein R6Q59_010350 [Mikania micrantha]
MNISIRLFSGRQTDGRTLNAPTASDVAAIVVEDGYINGIKHRELADDAQGILDVTMREFCAEKIQVKDDVYSLLLNSWRLFQQFLVDAYTMVESERFFMFVVNKPNYVLILIKSISALVASGNTQVSGNGKRVILPSLFTGGARYMMHKYLDAMESFAWLHVLGFGCLASCSWLRLLGFVYLTSVTWLRFHALLKASYTFEILITLRTSCSSRASCTLRASSTSWISHTFWISITWT